MDAMPDAGAPTAAAIWAAGATMQPAMEASNSSLDGMAATDFTPNGVKYRIAHSSADDHKFLVGPGVILDHLGGGHGILRIGKDGHAVEV